jgi:hypothetical protein
MECCGEINSNNPTIFMNILNYIKLKIHINKDY